MKTTKKEIARLEVREQVRTLAHQKAGEEDELNFYAAARELGCDEELSEELEIELTCSVLRACGAI